MTDEKNDEKNPNETPRSDLFQGSSPLSLRRPSAETPPPARQRVKLTQSTVHSNGWNDFDFNVEGDVEHVRVLTSKWVALQEARKAARDEPLSDATPEATEQLYAAVKALV